MRIGLISDIHFREKENTGTEAGAAADLRSCFGDFGDSRVDFMLQLGDIINGSEAGADDELRHVVQVFREYTGVCRHVIGNHCLAVRREKLLPALGLQQAYYSFSIETFRFAVLDGMDVSIAGKAETEADLLLLERSLGEPGMHDYCGGIGELQREWLGKELEEAEKQNQQVVVVCHFPLHPATTDQKHGLLWNHHEMRRVLTASPAVRACISGHYHEGGYIMENGIHYLVLKSFVDRDEHPEAAWSVAELHQTRLVVTGRNGLRLFDLEFN